MVEIVLLGPKISAKATIPYILGLIELLFVPMENVQTAKPDTGMEKLTLVPFT